MQIASNPRRGSRLAAGIVAVLLVICSMAACANDPRVIISGPADQNLATVRIEIADTPSARETGLMYRQHLDENAGMLFLFKTPQHLTFWMKNTEIPLDMIFADENGKVIGIVAEATPFSERQLSVPGDSQYVLEVNGGFAARHGIKAGDRLRFAGFVPIAKD